MGDEANRQLMDRLLAKPEMIAACASRDFRTIFRLARIAGLYPTGIARACGLTPGRVGDVLVGRHAVQKIDVIERISDGLRIPGHLLGLAARPWEKGVARSMAKNEHDFPDMALLWRPPEVAAMAEQFTRSDLQMDRRTALLAMLSTAVGHAPIASLERWLDDDPDGPPPTASRSGVGQEEVALLEKTARVFRQWDHQFGGGLRRKAVVGQLNEVSELLKTRHPELLERRLYRTMAELAGTAATMSWDSGLQKRAHNYYLIALQAAKAAGDRPFAANTLAGMARQQLYLGRASDALEIVRLAIEGAAEHASPAVRAMLFTREAWAYAQLGRISAFQRATARAEDALTSSTPVDEPHWIHYFGAAELAGVTGGRWLELARKDAKYADQAVHTIRRAVDLRGPTGLRSHGLDQVGLAEAQFIQGERKAAIDTTHNALAVAEMTQSSRVRAQMRDLYAYTNDGDRDPRLREVRDRMRELLTTK
ncbi:hypothetical protein [Yinghuangia sp. YIM S10712]|uniref:hypothetical protein n=1 Tax=Yinghuangia sp. YIM S10712 TaxID=3436930 RepID=UPI003F53D483